MRYVSLALYFGIIVDVVRRVFTYMLTGAVKHMTESPFRFMLVIRFMDTSLFYICTDCEITFGDCSDDTLSWLKKRLADCEFFYNLSRDERRYSGVKFIVTLLSKTARFPGKNFRYGKLDDVPNFDPNVRAAIVKRIKLVYENVSGIRIP